MSLVSKQITTAIETELAKRFPKSRVDKAVRAMAEEAVNILRNGFTGKGRQAKRFTKRYRAFKERVIKNQSRLKPKRGKTRTNKRIASLAFSKTPFAAQKSTDKYRLTGRLYSAIDYDIVQSAQFKPGKINASFRIFVRKKEAKKVEWLAAMGRDFFSIFKGADNRNKLKNRLIRIFFKKLGTSGDGTFRVR